jgi:hypothetical protein
MNKFVSFVLILAAALTAVMAQDQVPPPKPPLVRMPPAGSEWSLEIRNPTAPRGESPESSSGRVVPVRFEMRIGRNGVQQGTTRFSDGHTQTFYVVEDQILQQHDNAGDVAVLAPRDGAPLDLFDFRVRSFPALGWISLRNYVGVETLGKQPCHKYQLQNVAEFELPEKDVLVAWIRAGDGFPQRVQIGEVVYEFSEVRPFSGEVSLPALFQAAVEKRRAEQRRLNALKAANKY